MDRTERIQRLYDTAAERIVMLDGAMGTMIQQYNFDEAGYRGERFKDWPSDLLGNNDLLTLTQPQAIREIHEAYLRAGSDIAETNTFSSTSVAMADYGMEELVYELNMEGAKLAREVADAVTADEPHKTRFVSGAMGPTNRSASISPDVNDPGKRNITFVELSDAYKEAARGLMDGGVDILMVETIFDTLNAKAALFGIDELFKETGESIPVIISVTISDRSGRTLSGQTVEAFWYSVRHAKPFAVGLNCSMGAVQMRPHLAALSRIAETRISVYPNAGLPNEFGAYEETPDQTAAFMREWAQAGLFNLVGGCCGTTPPHIKAVAEAVSGIKPREIPSTPATTKLAGLEPFELANEAATA